MAYNFLYSVLIHALKNITNNGKYNNILIEIGSEPYGDSWLNALPNDHLIKATEYVRWYNYTYNKIKGY